MFMSFKDSRAESSVLEKERAGEHTTFKVYLFMLRVGTSSPRRVYFGLGLSSPSLALHHLEKLEKLKLVSKDDRGKYHAVRRRFGILRLCVATGRWLVPRTLFYMLFHLAIAVSSVFVFPSGIKEISLILSSIGFATNLLETYSFYELLP